VIPSSNAGSKMNDRANKKAGRVFSQCFRSAALSCLLVFSAGFMSGATGQGHTLTIVVEGISNTNGVVGVLVFSSARGWPKDNARAFRAIAVPAHQGVVTILVSDLPSNDYAVVVLHDENENRRLDRNWLGLPKEQWGMSNNPQVHFSAPSFKQACFTLSQDETICVILH
jgi:uncharacterized protein (DUF2141 family)